MFFVRYAHLLFCSQVHKALQRGKHLASPVAQGCALIFRQRGLHSSPSCRAQALVRVVPFSLYFLSADALMWPELQYMIYYSTNFVPFTNTAIIMSIHIPRWVSSCRGDSWRRYAFNDADALMAISSLQQMFKGRWHILVYEMSYCPSCSLFMLYWPLVCCLVWFTSQSCPKGTSVGEDEGGWEVNCFLAVWSIKATSWK